MLLERYYDESLAQASYLIGCERAREAIVIDPNRAIDQYIQAAQHHRVRITHVTETHIHADYLSGSRDLARRARATLLLSGHGGPDWSYRFAASDGATLLHDGDVITVGEVRLQVKHTPGHTPEHIAFVVTDAATGDRPMGMVSGDFIFVGDVGRPDLLERAAKVAGTMEQAARDLFASLGRTRDLPDYLQIWPGHGAGSACGKALGAVPQTTLGYERLFNPAFQQKTEADFVRWVLADQPEPPPYFAMMKTLNRDGPPGLETSGRGAMGLSDVDAAQAAGAWIVDTRSAKEFAAGHLPGSINIPRSRSFITYAGTALSYDRPIAVIAGNAAELQAMIAPFLLIGMDRVGLVSPEVFDQLAAARRATATLPTIKAAQLAEQLERNGDGPRVIDVRNRTEWKEGHIDKAIHIYLGHLLERTAELPRDEPIVVHCQSGTRSSIGASLLQSRGFTNVSNFAGGIDAWRKAGLPLVQDEP